MIGRLTGTVIQTNQDRIIVDVNGVGYLVRVIQRDFTKIPNRQTSTLYIYTHVKEDALDLFGFLNEDDLSVFKNLITVSGVGPKIGLSILSSYPAVLGTIKPVWEAKFSTASTKLKCSNRITKLIALP